MDVGKLLIHVVPLLSYGPTPLYCIKPVKPDFNNTSHASAYGMSQ